MALSDTQKKVLIAGVGIAAVFGVIFWSRRSSASAPPTLTIPETPGELLPVPSAGGGVPAPETPVFSDPATGTVIAGPSTPITAPAPGASDAIRTVEKNESWSNIASRAYGDYRWWPYLWDYNRAASTQFENPDVLRRGDSIRVPMAPPMDPTFQSLIFQRAAEHRAYWLCKKNKNASCMMNPIVFNRTPLESA